MELTDIADLLILRICESIIKRQSVNLGVNHIIMCLMYF